MCDGLIPGLRAGVIKKTMKIQLLILLLLILGLKNSDAQRTSVTHASGDAEAIRQIEITGATDIMSFQTLNRNANTVVLAQQIGNFNKFSLNQRSDLSSTYSNQSYSLQLGNYNELSVGQIGTGNTLLSFQLGYSATEMGKLDVSNFGFAFENSKLSATAPTKANYVAVGENNRLTLDQNGADNGLKAIQLGRNNSISAEQSGYNNYLDILQVGNANTVLGYQQENYFAESQLDVIVQNGENNTLSITDASKVKLHGNSYTQVGTNLSLQVDNNFVNNLGGIEITQTGHDMKVVIDQSYFIK